MDKINLELNNGTIIEVDVTSTVDSISITGTLQEVTQAIRAISTDTLKNATLYTTPEGELIINKVMEFFNGNRVDDGFNVIFSLREKTENEIINERLDEQDAALMELAEMIVG